MGTMGSSPILFVDCEGHQLGVAGGALSLISLRTSLPPRTTYIFDVLALSTSDLQSIFSVLELSSIQKVWFDGRKDHSALFHDHSIAMENVLDLQLADVCSRARRGEGVERQLARLSPYISVRQVTSNHANYTSLHKLLSLGHAMTEHRIRGARTGGVGELSIVISIEPRS